MGGAAIHINGPFSLVDAFVLAEDGGSVTAPLASSLWANQGRSLRISSKGNGSVIDLGSMTTVELQPGSDVRFAAEYGGKIVLNDLQQVLGSSTTQTLFWSNGGGLVLPSLTSVLGRVGLQVENQGTLSANALMTTSPWAPFSVRDSSRVELNSLTSWRGFSNEWVEGTPFTVESGSQVLMPAVTSVEHAYVHVSGAASALDVRSLQSLAHAYVEASDGAQLRFPAMTHFETWETTVNSAYTPEFSASGPNSLVDLSELASVAGPGTFRAVAAGGKIDVRKLATVQARSVRLAAGGPGSFVDLTSLTSISTPLTSDGSIDFEVGAGATIAAQKLIAIESNQSQLVAHGLEAILDLSGLKTVVAPQDGHFNVRADEGGKVDLRSLMVQPPGLGVTSDRGGMVDLSGLRGFPDNVTVHVSGGSVNLSSLTDAPEGLFLLAENQGLINLSSLQSVGGALFEIRCRSGGHVIAPSLTSIENALVTVAEGSSVVLGAKSAELVSTHLDILEGGMVSAGQIMVDAKSKVTAGGRVNGALVNHGFVGGPRFGLGELIVDGAYSQSAAAVLEVLVVGQSSGADKLSVLGPASLDGSVQVTLSKGFSAELGESFTILASTGLTGGFRWGGVLLADGKFLTPVSVGNEVALLVALTGDANLDGRVDLDDFGLLKAHFGTDGSLSQGNLNGDRVIDLNDFGLLKESFGRSGGPTKPGIATFPVPEPDTLALLTLGALGVLASRRLAFLRCLHSAQGRIDVE